MARQPRASQVPQRRQGDPKLVEPSPPHRPTSSTSSGAAAAPRVSRARQAVLWARDASPTPSGLQRAHRGPGGYCRRSGNQGTTSRPTRAHDTLQKISLRTRLSKPSEALQAWRGSPSPERLSKPGEALQAWRGSPSLERPCKPGEALQAWRGSPSLARPFKPGEALQAW